MFPLVLGGESAGVVVVLGEVVCVMMDRGVLSMSKSKSILSGGVWRWSGVEHVLDEELILGEDSSYGAGCVAEDGG